MRERTSQAKSCGRVVIGTRSANLPAIEFRGSGASKAAEYGAVAAVIRSVASASLRTAHTGAMRYDPKQPKIPAAAMTVEDAMLVLHAISGPDPGDVSSVASHLDSGQLQLNIETVDAAAVAAPEGTFAARSARACPSISP